MIEIPSLRRETRYGVPSADLFLFNREYIVGYSYLFRQPRWAMEVIDPENSRDEVERQDCFRPDQRVPERFRADLEDYVHSGFHRGHLIASADRQAKRIENSETFLLSNMAPQRPGFNSGVWAKLEEAVRKLAETYIEVYVTCGPLFDVGQKIALIGDDVVVPHAFFKSVLAENDKNQLKMWSFILPNRASRKPLADFRVPTSEVEWRAGVSLWDRLRGEKYERMKRLKERMWSQH